MRNRPYCSANVMNDLAVVEGTLLWDVSRLRMRRFVDEREEKGEEGERVVCCCGHRCYQGTRVEVLTHQVRLDSKIL